MSTHQSEATAPERDYATVSQFAEKYPAFPLGGIRKLLFNARTNGLLASGAIVKIGRRVLINEAKFFRWVEAQNKAA
jgi:hypothetical protein